MSIFNKIFGKSSNSEKAPTPQEAIQKLLEIEDLMRKRQDVLERKIDDELKTAKLNGTKNKRCKQFILFSIINIIFFTYFFLNKWHYKR